MKEGDANTRCFHTCVKRVKQKSRRISLDALRVGDFWLDKVIEVRGEISRYFMERFSDSETNRSTLDGVALPCLSVAEAKSFSVRFLFLEVNVVVAEIDESTSPGSNGFNF